MFFNPFSITSMLSHKNRDSCPEASGPVRSADVNESETGARPFVPIALIYSFEKRVFNKLCGFRFIPGPAEADTWSARNASPRASLRLAGVISRSR